MPKKGSGKDLLGLTFGRLLVLSLQEPRLGGIKRPAFRIRYLVRCSCGTEKVVDSCSLLTGNTTSCGCKKRGDWDSAHRNKWFSYIGRARKLGLDWELTEPEFYQFISQDCFYCGNPPANISIGRWKESTFVYTGIDRMDNKRGYTKDNIVPCCMICNKAKRDMSYSDFMAWLKRIASFQKEK